jgi:hypothetical protein
MLPNVRPVLHYVLDRPGAPERTITVRAANFSEPIAGPFERDIQLQWVASDPAALDPVEKTVIAWAGASTAAGRTYNLTFPRVYPPGGGGVVSGRITPGGVLPVQPRLRIYGPITKPFVTIQLNNVPTLTVAFLASFTIGAGHYVDVSTSEHTAFLDGDPTQSVIASIDWFATIWGVLMPANTYIMSLLGSTTSGVTQVQAMWHDRYLT